MSTHRNHNYRIAAEVLEDGRIRVKALGRVRKTVTLAAGTTLEGAAATLARTIEGARFSHVMAFVPGAQYVNDFAVYVHFTTPAEAGPTHTPGLIGTARGTDRIEYYLDAETAAAHSDDAVDCMVPAGATVVGA